MAYRQRVLELNASDERGIKVIREKVKSFASLSTRSTVPGYPSPPWKLIILDEADSLTGDAQTALRRTMELYSKGTRFCLCCNYVSRIIEPLVSRCAKFRFKAIPEEEGLGRLEEIVRREGISLSNDVDDVDDVSDDVVFDGKNAKNSTLLRRFIRRCEGDLRRAITCLQTAHRLNSTISWEILNDLTGSVKDDLVEASIELIKPGGGGVRDTSVNNPTNIAKWVTGSLQASGYSLQEFLSQFGEEILLGNHGFSDGKLSLMSEKIGLVEHRMMDGADGPLQIMSLLSYCQWLLSFDGKVNIMLS